MENLVDNWAVVSIRDFALKSKVVYYLNEIVDFMIIWIVCYKELVVLKRAKTCFLTMFLTGAHA